MRFATIPCFAILVLAIAMVAAASAPCLAGVDRATDKNEGQNQSLEEVDEIIYDMTIPWPFRRWGGDPVDTDGDGVFDREDQCPDTPMGATVDENGCPMDADGDGVYDGIDRCPDTPAGAEVDSWGCPMDTDGDGVLDGIDQCPGTPRGATVDDTGCPSDSDRDGVFDGIDRCPNTPSGTKVDEFGCPVKKSELETQLIDTGMIRTSNILFETAKADLKPESREILDAIGNVLIQWPELQIEVGGHADARGSDEFNKTLSDKRAKSVKDYLTTNFPAIDPENLSTAGYGESQPIASNDTPEGMSKNRRVEFKVLNEEALDRAVGMRGKSRD